MHVLETARNQLSAHRCLRHWWRVGTTKEHDRPPADRDRLIAAGHPPFEWNVAPREEKPTALPKGLPRVALRENAGSHPQEAISRQPVVFG